MHSIEESRPLGKEKDQSSSKVLEETHREAQPIEHIVIGNGHWCANRASDAFTAASGGAR